MRKEKGRNWTISITYIKNNISIRTSQWCSEFSIYRITKMRLKITLYEKYFQICGYQSATGFRVKRLALKAPIYCNCSRVVLKNLKPQSFLMYFYFMSLCASASTLVTRASSLVSGASKKSQDCRRNIPAGQVSGLPGKMPISYLNTHLTSECSINLNPFFRLKFHLVFHVHSTSLFFHELSQCKWVCFVVWLSNPNSFLAWSLTEIARDFF